MTTSHILTQNLIKQNGFVKDFFKKIFLDYFIDTKISGGGTKYLKHVRHTTTVLDAGGWLLAAGLWLLVVGLLLLATCHWLLPTAFCF